MKNKWMTSSALLLCTAAVISACGYDQAGNTETYQNPYQGNGNNVAGTYGTWGNTGLTNHTAGVRNNTGAVIQNNTGAGAIASANGISSFLESQLEAAGILGAHVLVLDDTVVIGRSYRDIKDNDGGASTAGNRRAGNGIGGMTSGIAGAGTGMEGMATRTRGTGQRTLGTDKDETRNEDNSQVNAGGSDLEQARSIIRGIFGDNVKILMVYDQKSINAIERVKANLKQSDLDDKISTDIQYIMDQAQSASSDAVDRSNRTMGRDNSGGTWGMNDNGNFGGR